MAGRHRRRRGRAATTARTGRSSRTRRSTRWSSPSGPPTPTARTRSATTRCRPSPSVAPTPGTSISSPRASTCWACAIPDSSIDQANGGARVGSRFFRGSGTSQSAAVVSGLAALYLQKYPGAAPDQVKAALMANATAPNYVKRIFAGWACPTSTRPSGHRSPPVGRGPARHRSDRYRQPRGRSRLRPRLERLRPPLRRDGHLRAGLGRDGVRCSSTTGRRWTVRT